MFLNIITPCSRINNLKTIEHSINIPKENYRWIIVFDNDCIPNNIYIPEYSEIYAHRDNKSIVGNAQRNYALSLIKDGHIYFNDDDTIIHKNLWNKISKLDDYDFISFEQEFTGGKKRLLSNKIQRGSIDSHNFISSYRISKNIRFNIVEYGADGIFAEQVYKNAKNKIHIQEVLSTYNALRKK
jgi:hypothetical protein